MEKGEKYEGELDEQGNKSGKGTLVWPDGSIYEGYFLDDKASGRGRLIHADGDVYDGDWKND